MTTPPSQVTVYLWNRTDHLLGLPDFVSRVMNDNEIEESLRQTTPDLLWLYGPEPDPALVDRLRSRVPALSAWVRVDLLHPGKDFQVISGSVQIAQRLIASFDRLKSMPMLAQKLMSALQNQDVSPEELTELVSADAGLVATLLRHANSPAHGLMRKVTNIPSAIVLLGLRQVTELAIAASIIDRLQTNDADSELMWKRRLLVAASASKLGGKLLTDVQSRLVMFVVGMLHDIGLSMLGEITPPLILSHKGAPPLHDRSALYHECVHSLGCHPGDLGAALARQWNLPSEVEIGCRFHHTRRSLDLPVIPESFRQVLFVLLAGILVADAIFSGNVEAIDEDLLALSRCQTVPFAMGSRLIEVSKQVYQDMIISIQTITDGPPVPLASP